MSDKEMLCIAFFQVTSSLISTVRMVSCNCGFVTGSATATTPKCVFRCHVSVFAESELCVDLQLRKFSPPVVVHLI